MSKRPMLRIRGQRCERSRLTKPVPGKAIRQLLDQCAQRQTHDLLLMVEGRSAEALEASVKGFSHRALDLGVRLQADCPPNERQKPLPANKRSDDSDLA
jgi:hypothetical protein